MPIRLWAPRIDFSVLRRELDLPTEFGPDALREAEEAATTPPLPATDRRDIPLVTIDPASSQDLDQAMHLSRRSGGGYRVCYAIADVASYVRPGGALEAETWARGQTIYLPDGRIPLHPPVLSEGAASLFPDVARAAVLWTIDLETDGAIAAVRLERAQVRSRAKLDYAGVQASVDAGTLPEPIACSVARGRLGRRGGGRGRPGQSARRGVSRPGRRSASRSGLHGVRSRTAPGRRAWRCGRAVRPRHGAVATPGRPVRDRGLPGRARRPGGARLGPRRAAAPAEMHE